MSKPIIHIRRDAFKELKNYMIGNNAHNGYIETYNFIFKPEKQIIDVINREPVIIKRHGKIIYEE